MILKAIVLSFLIAVIGFVVVGMRYSFFRKVEITELEIGPFHLVYRELEGLDSKAIQETKTTMQYELASLGVTPDAPFDIYYPKDSGKPNKIGFVINETEIEKIDDSNNLQTHTVPKGRFITTAYPYKDSLSYIFMYIKVDPALRAHRKKNGYEEVYAASRFDGNSIFCLQPIILLR